LGRDAEAAGGEEQGLFEEADVVGGGEVAGAEVEDGVGDELAGTVVGDVAAAVGVDDCGALPGERAGVEEEVFGAGAAAEGVDGRVLEDGQRFGGAIAHGGGGLLLPAPGVVVGDDAEPVETNFEGHYSRILSGVVRQGGDDGGPGAQDAVHGAAAGDFLQAGELLRGEVAFDGDVGVDEGKLVAAGGGDLLRREGGRRRDDVFDADVDGDVVKGPLLVVGVHAHGDGDAGAERGEQELMGRGTEIVAAVGDFFVGGDDVAAVGGLDGVGVAGEGVDGDFGHGGASGIRLGRGREGVDGWEEMGGLKPAARGR
jgi:hypothetical protein